MASQLRWTSKSVDLLKIYELQSIDVHGTLDILSGKEEGFQSCCNDSSLCYRRM